MIETFQVAKKVLTRYRFTPCCGDQSLHARPISGGNEGGAGGAYALQSQSERRKYPEDHSRQYAQWPDNLAQPRDDLWWRYPSAENALSQDGRWVEISIWILSPDKHGSLQGEAHEEVCEP